VLGQEKAGSRQLTSQGQELKQELALLKEQVAAAAVELRLSRDKLAAAGQELAAERRGSQAMREELEQLKQVSLAVGGWPARACLLARRGAAGRGSA
jgi:hypothetical protein